MSVTVRRPFHHFSPTRGKKWRARFILFLLLLASVIIQGVSGGAGILFNFRPDLVLIVVIYWSLQEGPVPGWFAGMAGGIMADLFSAGILGLHSVSLAVTAVLIAFGSSSLYRGHFTTRIIMVAVGAGISGLLYYLLLLVFSVAMPWTVVWRSVLWPTIWQTTLIAPLWLWLTDVALRRVRQP